MHWIDGLILGAYVAYSIASGVRGAKQAGRGLSDYFLAGRSLRGWEAGLSMAATQFAADTPLVITGLVASAGVFAVWRFWVYALAFLLMALVLGGPWRRAGVVTDAQLAELRYHGRAAAALRAFKAIYLGVVFNCAVLAMVLLATTRLTEPFLHWNAWLPPSVFDPIEALVRGIGFPLTASGAPCPEGACMAGECLRARCIGHAEWAASTNNVISVALILVVTTLYSSTGGLRSVVKTDVVQLALALLGTLAFAWVVIDRIGGLSALPARLDALPSSLSASELTAFTPGRAASASSALLGVLAVQWICQINADGSGYLAQRTMACRSDADARRAGVVFAVVQVLVRSLIWLPIALGLLVLSPPSGALQGDAFVADREASFVRGMADLLPPGVLGLMITGMLGAFASTVDTHLNWGASYLTNDLVGRFFMRDPRSPENQRRLVWIARLTNLLILLAALAIVPALDSIQTAWRASLLLGAGLGVVLVLRWLWWRVNAFAELATLVTSAALAPVLLLTVPHDATRLLIMAGSATAAGIVAALCTRPTPQERLAAFYERVRPPGFWSPVSPDPAADRARLAYGLAATFGGATSIFASLVGLGTWLLGSPAPVFFPWRSPWIALCLAFGAGSVPLWIALTRRAAALDRRDES